LDCSCNVFINSCNQKHKTFVFPFKQHKVWNQVASHVSSLQTQYLPGFMKM